jgi:RHS repeat-associated protein
MPGRTFTSSIKYRYSFNGKESDPETIGTSGSTQDYGMRIYNPSLGKFLSTDPLQKDYPFLTPYQFASNTPIQAIDLDGLEQYYYLLAKTDGKSTLTLTSVENDWIDLNLQQKAIYISYGGENYRFTSDSYGGDGNAYNYGQMGSFLKDPEAFKAQMDKDRNEFVTLCAIGGALGLSEKLANVGQAVAAARGGGAGIKKSQASANNGVNSSGNKSQQVSSKIGRKIYQTAQNKHKLGTNEYKISVNQQKRYRSVLTEDAQGLLDDYHSGMTTVLSDNEGQKSMVVDFNKPIGNIYDENTGALIKEGVTTGAIKYGEGKIHIVPIDYKKTECP